jgi:hypothetical protein
MLRKSLVVAISAIIVGAFGLGIFAPAADAVTPTGNSSTIIAARHSNVQACLCAQENRQEERPSQDGVDL